jgi:hypothetical protein
METAIAIAAALVKLTIDLVGQEKAQQLVSEETQRRAHEAADTVANARQASGV